MSMKRRSFLQSISALYASGRIPGRESRDKTPLPKTGYSPGRIPNEYSLLLPGERQALATEPSIDTIAADVVAVRVGKEQKSIRTGDLIDGWQLKAITPINGTATAVFEKHITHQGAIVFVTKSEGVILRIPKRIGSLAKIRPRPTSSPHGVRFLRHEPYVPGPDEPGNYILHSNEDPCYENVAALGAEYIGYTLVANEQAGPLRSLFLEASGASRQLSSQPQGQGLWAPDLAGPLFDPSGFFPGEDPTVYRYLPGYSKRTLLGGYLPVADIGVWNPESRAGYEVMVLLPPGADATPIGRIRFIVPEQELRRSSPDLNPVQLSDGLRYIDRYWNTSPERFFSVLAGVANYWIHFFEDQMTVDIPDPWLLDAARAGITLSRCSYRGLEPTYQIGEGAYTKIPERSHALFPVAHYEFVWAHQLWNLTEQVDPYFQHYLDGYIMPDGNFLYNTQDQVEAPLNTGVFLWNSARAYDYTRDLDGLKKRLLVLERMINFVLTRYQYSKTQFPPSDRRHGLIWGSPEADLGDPNNDFSNSHPYYFQNATWTWRGLKEHARCLERAGQEHNLPQLTNEAKRLATIASEMRALIERSLQATLNAEDPAMRESGITPFTPDDIHHYPNQLSSYENHRFMMDWFTADWGEPALDLGHLKHRELAGYQIMGLHTDADVSRTSNFMEHGTLSVRIRQDDYRPFLLTLYSLCCYAADSGNRYAPEDAYVPGSYPGEGSPYGWSAVVNSVLQPTLGLRWLLCYEESDRDVCHLQKAAPKQWFVSGHRIHVAKCPTRFGLIGWTTSALSNTEWEITVHAEGFTGDLVLHIHPPNGNSLKNTSLGKLERNKVVISREALAKSPSISLRVQ
jgi:hypothetical protein